MRARVLARAMPGYANHGLEVPEATKDSLNKVFALGDVPTTVHGLSSPPVATESLELGLGLMYVKRGPPCLAS